MEPKWSQHAFNFELKRKWNGFGIPSESVGNQWVRPMEVVWNWSANPTNYFWNLFGIRMGLLGNE